METPAFTRRDLETALIERCWKDAEFKRQVITDPKSMLERHTGQKMPAHVKIFVHEEDAHTLHFSIPPAPTNMSELSDADLEQVAGGTDVAVTILTIALTAGVASAGVSVASVAATKYQW